MLLVKIVSKHPLLGQAFKAHHMLVVMREVRGAIFLKLPLMDLTNGVIVTSEAPFFTFKVIC